MEIITFNEQRGIHAIFNGYGEQAYVIHSSFYGFVGYANIDRDLIGEKKIVVDLYLGNGSKNGYWSLLQIVKRGITKAEHRFVADKKIVYNIHYLDKFSGDTPNYEWGIGRPNETFKIKLDEGIRAV